MLFAKDFLSDQQVFRATNAPQAPLVSVILPTYARYKNGYLQRAIESVLAQTFKDFEFLIVDDGSRDGSKGFIEQCLAADPRVVHIRHERNSGLHAIRMNEGIELARGQYLAFQFDDDSWRPLALQALVTEASRHAEPTVIVGHCHAKGKTSQVVFPHVEPNFSSLYEANHIANNSVLIPRCLVEQYGMYDCHIAMRRLCDWDLWLRYMKYVPFVVIDEVVSDVFAEQPDSLAMTVPYDLSLVRYFQNIPRDHLLTFNRWHDYEIDSLHVGEVEIEKGFRHRLYEKQIAPYYFKFRHYFPQIEGFSATLPPIRKSVLYTRNLYDATYDIGLNPYDARSNRRGNYKAHFQFQHQTSPDWVREADILLLIRPFLEQVLLTQALTNDIPVGLYFDDDFLTLHEYNPEFSDSRAFAPGTPYHQNVTEMLRQADTVWVTNHFMGESIGPFNPRTIPHNGAILQDWLPTTARLHTAGQPLRIGYVGTAYRLEEFGLLWDALLRLSHEYRDQLIFEFWGLDVSSLPSLSSPVIQRPYIHSYFLYLKRLKEAEFDILLAPLLDYPPPRLAKAPSKYYQMAVAGALGIFSNVPPYEKLLAGLTCLKPDNTVEDWYSALREAITMPSTQFDLMRQRMLQHVREEFTETAQIHLHEAALRATEFHARTRTRRYADGRPRVLYVLPSLHEKSTAYLWQQVRLMRSYGIEPVIVFAQTLSGTGSPLDLRGALTREKVQIEFVRCTSWPELPSPAYDSNAQECREIRELLERYNPVLVHSVTFLPSFGRVCQEMGMSYVVSVASVDALDEHFSWRADFNYCAVTQSDSLQYATRWSQVLGSEKFCARGLVSQEFFDLGLRRSLENLGQETNPSSVGRLHIVVISPFQERERQLEVIEAIGWLSQNGFDCRLNMYGDLHSVPDYVGRCRQHIQILGLEDCVNCNEYREDGSSILQSADMLLSLSPSGSFPDTMKEAMASGVLVVALPTGGIPELIIDGVSGIVCIDASVESIVESVRRVIVLGQAERRAIVEQARRVARSEFHPHRAANDLMTMYVRALESNLAFESCRNVVLPDIRSTIANQNTTVHGEVIENIGTPPVLAATHAQVLQLEAKPAAIRQMLAAREGELARTQASLIHAQEELADHKRRAEELQGTLTTREGELARAQDSFLRFAVLQQKAQAVAAELDAVRQRRVMQWLAHLSPGGDLSNDVDPAFQQLKDDSFLFTPDLKGFRLQPSSNLQLIPYLAYPLDLRRPNLCGVILAPILDLPVSQGIFGVEIISPANTIVAQSIVPFDQIDERVPTRLLFPPIADSQQGRFWLRVFVRDVAALVRVFEWRKYSWGGFGRLQIRAFCGFLFQ